MFLDILRQPQKYLAYKNTTCLLLLYCLCLRRKILTGLKDNFIILTICHEKPLLFIGLVVIILYQILKGKSEGFLE